MAWHALVSVAKSGEFRARRGDRLRVAVIFYSILWMNIQLGTCGWRSIGNGPASGMVLSHSLLGRLSIKTCLKEILRGGLDFIICGCLYSLQGHTENRLHNHLAFFCCSCCMVKTLRMCSLKT